MALNERQQRFADYYIETGNAEESATRAGYSARGNTTKLLQNTTIKAYMLDDLKVVIAIHKARKEKNDSK